MTLWLMTSTFYGQWLPGDERGSVTNVYDERPDDPDTAARRERERPGDEYEGGLRGLHQAAAEQLAGPVVCLKVEQAEELLEQFQETAQRRTWSLHAVSIMFNHTHLVVETPPPIRKKQILRDFKSYGAGRLNKRFGTQPSGTWWTESGSCRVVRHLGGAAFYVCHRQPNPLLVWSLARGRIPPSESHPENRYPSDGRSEPPSEPLSEPPA